MAGISGTSSGSKAPLELMLGRLRHRGPADEWLQQGKRIALGCCVLPSEAKHSGRTHSQVADTAAVIDGHLHCEDEPQLFEADLLISLYSRFGSRFVEQLDGDFAFALATEDELILARDTVGMRPLFYGYEDGNLYFASEMKALVGLCAMSTLKGKGFIRSRAYNTRFPNITVLMRRLAFWLTYCERL